MRLSVWPAAQHPWADTLAFARHCDAAGWHGFWFEDHLMSPAGALHEAPEPTLELWTTLAGIAAATTSLHLGSLVASVTYRHPGVIASAALTLDEISEGRAVLGVGAGWQADEHEAYGLPLGSRRERSDRFSEGCAAIRSLIHHERTTFDGDYFTFSAATREPKGYRGRSIPLLIAGKGPDRTLRTVAACADIWNAWATPSELIALREVLDDRCGEIGRAPSEIETTTQAFLCDATTDAAISAFLDRWGHRPVIHGTDDQIAAQVHEYAEAGVNELTLCDWGLPARQQRIEAFSRAAAICGLGGNAP